MERWYVRLAVGIACALAGANTAAAPAAPKVCRKMRREVFMD